MKSCTGASKSTNTPGRNFCPQCKTYPVVAPKRVHKSQAGVLYCARCSAVHHNKHWHIPDKSDQIARSGPGIQKTLCPGCDCVEKGLYNGEVVLESQMLPHIRDQVPGLLKNVEDKCWHDNAASRIFSIQDLGQQIKILTTTEWLAIRIGKQMEKAYKGELDIKWSSEERFVRVHWSRQLNPIANS